MKASVLTLVRLATTIGILSSFPAPSSGVEASPALVERLAHSTETLRMEDGLAFFSQLPEQRVTSDTGINVLIDLAHSVSFQTMWRLPPDLRRHGLRAIGSEACLDTVLTPGAPCRARVPVGGRWPFAWVPAPRFNVVYTRQGGFGAQPYLPGEIEALREFVQSGGGLVVVGGGKPDEESLKQWSLNALITKFGASFGTTAGSGAKKKKEVCLAVGPEWEVLRKGTDGSPVCARRVFGKGRVVVSAVGLVSISRKKSPEVPGEAPEEAAEEAAQSQREFIDLVKWAAAGAPPVGGTLRLPQEKGGGGPIYPELETRFGDITVFYANNQIPELIKTIKDVLPRVRKQLFEWYPSKVIAGDPLYLILASGSGGGWAVNNHLPKEAGTISSNANGVINVFGHEQAHTMGGPPNARGETAGSVPFGNASEAHAGFWQRKVNVLFLNKNTEPQPYDKLKSMDLAKGEGKAWGKLWWIWRKLDDRYGTTWYPRWKWVQHTRWQDDPKRSLTWDEIVEDMSIAVGEDLFPWFRKMGTTLNKDRFERATFMGQTLELPVAPLDLSPAGPFHTDPIGDYTKPLEPKRR